MGFLDFFKSKKQKPQPSAEQQFNSKEDIFRMVFEQMSQRAPSDHFASGAVFDIVRSQHAAFEQFVRANDVMSVLKFFRGSYLAFCNDPSIVNLPKSIIDMRNNDTDPTHWNADTFQLSNGNAAAQCFMPVQSDTLEARIFGIVLGKDGDGYYYCMLNKDENVPSEVKRNVPFLGTQTVGSVKGRGFDLMNAFLACMEKDFNATGSRSIFPQNSDKSVFL